MSRKKRNRGTEESSRRAKEINRRLTRSRRAAGIKPGGRLPQDVPPDDKAEAAERRIHQYLKDHGVDLDDKMSVRAFDAYEERGQYAKLRELEMSLPYWRRKRGL